MNELSIESKYRILEALHPDVPRLTLLLMREVVDFDANLALGEVVPWMRGKEFDFDCWADGPGTYACSFALDCGMRSDGEPDFELHMVEKQLTAALAIFLALDQHLLTLEEAKP
jgi:hypothetical protein